MLFDWIAAARPKTLGAAIAPVVVGSVLGWKISGQWSTWLLLCTLGSTIALQVATNWFNDALDFMKGADTQARVGPRRITAAGVMSPRTVMTAAWGMLGVAVLLSLPLIQARGWAIVVIGVPSLYFCYGYTGGPMPLAYRGLGELFVILFFGFVAVLGSAFVQSGEWLVAGLVAGFQIGCLSTVLIAINNLRDQAEDRTTGKRTLAVRFGVTFARVEITALIILAHLAGLYWWENDFPRALTVPLAVVPVGLFLILKIWVLPPGPAYNRLLALSGMQLLLFAALFCWGVSRTHLTHL
ncbi:1,4-dihydroxy-2-naphthoate octaprenyltransferase [Prosthecobacter dejongeii]|uniref:1,4-dihydroxy-2-naphthoate octaprenyltransferase n=1 Tax=Prosthecobacter dejongeii TaxID=48465 RepID=A0A7W8DQK5_9BACT|nr:1,4-dihydroxy-2-naphthoate octaprenyltransferase [Prosthecobacter dejongeii]MBB5038031.1 1,4-dihydroxy-2-naphthoate octaprenyltransferase [Prosthecobacter dejongeii]